jgi:hypothetical protein
MKKPRSHKPRQWQIVGYVSTEIVFEGELPHARYPETRMHELLRALACKGLTYREIVEAHAKSEGGEFGALLKVDRDGSPDRLVLSCGESPHFIATLKIA